MNFGLRIGLFITFTSSGVGFIITSECIGIGSFVLAAVWGILFVNPRSPVRSRCWSVGDKLSIRIEHYGDFPPKGNRQYLTVYKALRALSPIKVDKILLSIGRKKIVPLDWKSREVTADESGYVNFDRPEWLHSGNHPARLIAYTPYGYSKSEKFILTVKG